jgi:hypothetical protein
MTYRATLQYEVVHLKLDLRLYIQVWYVWYPEQTQEHQKMSDEFISVSIR